MKYRKIWIKYSFDLKKLYFTVVKIYKLVFHGCEIYVVFHGLFSSFSIETTSDLQTPITFLLVDKTQRAGIYFFIRSQEIFWL